MIETERLTLKKTVFIVCTLNKMKPPQVDGHFTPLKFEIVKSQTHNENGRS